MDYAYNSAFGIARILCTLQYEKSNFALRASIWSSAEISEALRAFPAILVVRDVKTWYMHVLPPNIKKVIVDFLKK